LIFTSRKDLPASVSIEVLCGRILERHRDAIRVQKSHIAVANLARIIEATLKLSNKQGFQATTLRDLAKASGLSMGGLYSYFSGKPMLLSMILREVASTVAEVLSEPPPEVAMNAGAHLRWVIELHIRLTEAMQPWFVFAYMEAKAFPPSERRIAIDSEALTETIIARVLEQGAAAGVFTLSDVGLTASLIKPLLQDWYVKRAKYRKRGISIDTYIAAVIDFVTAAISEKDVAPSVSFKLA
jgi:AcrR family transcriptional regulator